MGKRKENREEEGEEKEEGKIKIGEGSLDMGGKRKENREEIEVQGGRSKEEEEEDGRERQGR